MKWIDFKDPKLKKMKWPNYQYKIVDPEIFNSLPNYHRIENALETTEQLYEILGRKNVTSLTVDEANKLFPQVRQKSNLWYEMRKWKIIHEGEEKTIIGASDLGNLAGCWSKYTKKQFKATNWNDDGFSGSLYGKKKEFTNESMAKVQWGNIIKGFNI